jgi:putative addiction module antidote
MTYKVKIGSIGNSAGIILPKELLARLRIEKGDEFSVIETAGGGMELRPADAEFEEQMAAARQVMKKYRNALRELAK